MARSINKFEGDAALAVFGAPLAMDGAASSALRAARVPDAQLRDHVGELKAGIGAAMGPVIAGSIGAEQRYEYTVIGDPLRGRTQPTKIAAPGQLSIQRSRGR